MAKDLTLTIRDDQAGTDYVYGGDRLLVDVEGKETRVNGLDIEVEDMPMRIGPDANGAPELLGISDPLALPERTYRAKLEDGSGTLVMDGAIVTSDAVFDEPTSAFEVVLINQAANEFWQLLDTEFIPLGANSNITTTDVQVYEKDLGGGENYLNQTRIFYQPRSVLEYIFDQFGISYQMPTYLWEYTADYANSVGFYDSEDVRISLGRRNMRTLVEEITKMAGWRVFIEYQSFPSKDLSVEMRPTDWPLPAAQQVLDGQETEESYAVTIEPNRDNFILQMRNGPGESSPDPTAEAYNSGPIPSFGVPPAYGSVAPEKWTTPPLSPSDITENRKVLGDVVSSEFKVAPVAVETEIEENTDVEYVNIGPVRHVTDENGFEKFRDLLMIEVKQDPNDSKYYGVHSRRPHAQEYDGDKTLGHSGAWASAAYEEQPLRRSSLRELEGDFFSIGEQTVGDSSYLVEMLGSRFYVQQAQRDVSQLLSTLTLRRPLSVTENSAVGAMPTGNRSRWAIESPVGEYRTVNRGNGKEDWILMHWERTPIAEAVELWYEVEIKDTRDSTPTWDRIEEVADKTFATASTHQYKSAGNGGASYSDGDIKARVRPIKGIEIVSGSKRVVEGFFKEFRINAA